MARLPQPGGDNGNWGDILNDFLLQAHKSDGTVKDNIVSSTTIQDNTITEAKLDSAVQTKLNAASGSYLPLAGGTLTGTLNSRTIVPSADSTYDSGSSSRYWANTYTDRLYVNSAAYLDGGAAGVLNATGDLRVSAQGSNATSVITKAYADQKRVQDVITIDPDGSFHGNISVTDYANFSVAAQAAIDLAATAGRVRHVVVLGDDTTNYAVGDTTILIPSDFTFEAVKGVTFTMRANSSGTNPIAFKNSDQTNGNQNITIIGIHGNGNGTNQVASQSSGGVFFHFVGADVTYVDCHVEESVRFNSFVSTLTGTSISGTATFTIDSPTIAGSGTAFTTELAVGQRLRSVSGNLSPPISKISSNTSLTLAAHWPHATESGVAATVTNGVHLKAYNSTFGKTYENDTFGGGGWDYPMIDDCTFEYASGYGLGTTGSFGGGVTNIHAHHNINGLGLERIIECNFGNIITEFNTSKGVNLINGSQGNRFTNVISRYNADGFYDANTSSSKGYNAHNSYVSCTAEFNTNNGYNFGGSYRPSLTACLARNNSTSGAGTYYGYVFQDANGYNTIRPVIKACRGYDDQSSQTQTKDIYFDSGCTDAKVDFVGFDNISGLTAPNYSANMQILAGGKQIQIISGTTRATNNYENYVLCNQDTYDHLLPRLNSIVDGHRVKYIYSGSGTPTWTFARSTSDGFGTLEDYTQIPQDGHFWIEWLWDNTTKRWFITGTNHTAAFGNHLNASSNLSDLTNASTARTNLGLGSVATLSATDTALTTPNVTTGIKDANGNTVLSFTPTASAVTGLDITNAISGGTVTLAVAGSGSNSPLVIKGQGSGLMTMRPGSNGTNAIRWQDATGTNNVIVADTTNIRLAVGQTTPTAKLDVAASTTSASSIRIRSGTAPTTPNAGDMWFDGTNLKFYDGTTTRTITWT